MIMIACDYCGEIINEPDFIGVDANDNWIADFIPIKSPKEYEKSFCDKDCLINFIESVVVNEGVLMNTIKKGIKIQET